MFSFFTDKSKKMIKAANKHDTKKVLELLNEGADPNATDKRGNTVLMLIHDAGDLTHLLAKKVDINKKNIWGITPLMTAARTGNIEAVRILMDHGADVNAVDNDGYNALSYALGRVSHPSISRSQRAAMAILLLEKGAPIVARGEDFFIIQWALEVNGPAPRK